MKYIISESQNERIAKYMYIFFDATLTPFGGWKPKQYDDQLNNVFRENELFIPLENSGEGDDELLPDEYEHIYYSTCENDAYEYGEDECPEVGLENSKYKLLNDALGLGWEPYFLEWFQQNSGLPAVRVRRH